MVNKNHYNIWFLLKNAHRNFGGEYEPGKTDYILRTVVL